MLESISPLEYRYLDIPQAAELRRFLSEEAFIRYLARVEATLVDMYAKEGKCSIEVAQCVEKAAAEITAEEVYHEEKKIHHQVRAVVNCLSKRAGEHASPWIHLGATSHDIVCTADSLRYRDFVYQSLLPCLCKLEKSLMELALREKNTPQIGRTHGQHAVPTTFGFTLAEYVSRLGSRILKVAKCAEDLRGKFSGAVGAYNAQSLLIDDPLAFEKKFLAQLNLKPADHSTQIVQPEYLLDLLHTVVSTLGILANLADNMRHLQRSEIDEIAEHFGAAQVGSSTMPHKRNPISFENIKSLYKTFMPRMITYYLDQISEHQRDLTNSASARFIGEIFCGLYIAAQRMESTISKTVVNYPALQKNLHLNGGEIMAEPCYLILSRHGKAQAHESVRKYVQSGGNNLLEFVEKQGIQLTEQEKEILSGPEHYLGLSSQKTEIVCSYWKEKIEALEKR
jgi:adenylosuccinate lyase